MFVEGFWSNLLSVALGPKNMLTLWEMTNLRPSNIRLFGGQARVQADPLSSLPVVIPTQEAHQRPSVKPVQWDSLFCGKASPARNADAESLKGFAFDRDCASCQNGFPFSGRVTEPSRQGSCEAR